MKSAIVWAITILAIITCAAVSLAQDKTAPPAAATTLPSNWEQIDQRFVFFTTQLASTETSLNAVNKALKVAGYHQSTQQQQASQFEKNNEALDRNGGGPVPWEQFYGKTASQFYRSTDFAAASVNGNSSLAALSHTESGQRPPQFDYIYRANANAQQRAQDEVDKLGGQIDALVERRKQLETEQAACWAKIAFQGIASQHIDSKPIYRFALKIDGTDDLAKQRTDALSAATEFVRITLRGVADAQDVVEKDPPATFDALDRVIATAAANFNDRILHSPKLALDSGDNSTSLGKVSASIQRLADVTKNIADSYHKAIEGDIAGDDAQKQTFRAYTQQALFDCATNVAATAQFVTTLAKEWNANVDVDHPLPLEPPTEVAKVGGGTSNPVSASNVTSSSNTPSEPLPANRGVLKLTRSLPLYLIASGPFSADKDGIRLAQDANIQTRSGDFLDKDFIFDVYLTVPREYDKDVNIGIGDTTDKNSIRILIHQEGAWPRGAFLPICTQWGERFGDIHPGESYIFRLERHKGPITASVGSIENGQFVAEMSQTVSDPKTMAADLSEKRAHLFFYGKDVLFSQVRLLTGPAADAGQNASAASTNAGTTAGDATASANNGASAAPSAAAADAANGFYPLTSPQLPPAFSATGTYNATPDGLKPFEKCVIQTKAEDFLSKDFIFEATVDVPQKMDKEQLVIGIGDSTDKGSLRMTIRVDGGWGKRAFICLGDEWGKNFGDIREGGVRVMRLERHGTAITASIGSETDGKFSPELSQTVSDVKSEVPGLSDRYAHLFFSGQAVWSQLRLVTGDAAAEQPPTVASADPPPKPHTKKKK